MFFFFRMSFSLVEYHWAYHTQGQAPSLGAVGLHETNSMAFSWMSVLFWHFYFLEGGFLSGLCPFALIFVFVGFLCVCFLLFVFVFLGGGGGRKHRVGWIERKT